MSITRTSVTDDDGSGTTGTIGNNAWLQALFDTLDARWSRVTITSTGTQNNLSVSDADLVLLNNASALTITGIAAPSSPAKPGKKLVLCSIGAGQVNLAQQNASSTAANRLINFATSANTPLAAGSGIAVYVYDDNASRWRLIGHDQGAWITPTFSAGDFTAQTGNWTVDSGDVLCMKYRLDGRSLSVMVQIEDTDVSATPTYLQVAAAQFGGFTITTAGVTHALINNAGGGYGIGVLQHVASGGLRFFRSDFGTSTFSTTSSDNTDVAGQATFEVT